MKWTADQQKAIEGRNGTMLVSAAAGSGKTAVLVERVIQRICDKDNPCSIDSLLIVTFTKAAAAQLKSKIHSALSAKIAKDPEDKNLRHQKMMLPYANICTIDSFCINLVRENFHILDITPDFAILDDAKNKLLESKAVLKTVEELYAQNSPEFRVLNNLISDEKNDSKLIEAILKINKSCGAFAFPESRIKAIEDSFCPGVPIEKTVFGSYITEELINCLTDAVQNAEYCSGLIEEEPVLIEKYQPAFISDIQTIGKLIEQIPEMNWNEISEKLSSLKYSNFGRVPNGYSSNVKKTVSDIRTNYKKAISKQSSPFRITQEIHDEDAKLIDPVIKILTGAVKTFRSELAQLKKEENAFDFSDILHLAVKLLLKEENGIVTRTDFAEELSENYVEILVDEYQDVNQAQDYVFYALSKNDTNRFMVGDVKQSIYVFRQAMPDIFLSLKNRLMDYNGKDYPAKVTLSSNFRSRTGITDTVNFIFSEVMSEKAGDLNYTKEEYLNPGADYSEHKEPDAEVHLIECDSKESTKMQARFIGNYIKEKVNSGVLTGTSGAERPVSYGDFAVLLRNTKDKAKIYSAVLEEMGIPAKADNSEGFLSAPEVSFLISLIKVIDNPVNDIPLTAVLLSPVFGFTPDELSQMRIDNPDGSIYSCLTKSAENGNEKSQKFIESLNSYRNISLTLPAGEFAERLTEDTGYRAIIGAMPHGNERLSNVNMFIDTANEYEKNGLPGTSAFIRYLDKLEENKISLISKSVKSEISDAVTITTIHKSKGLEFPFCFVASCESKFNDEFNRENLIISRNCGIGIKRLCDRVKYETLPHYAAVLESKKTARSEELRILYVALTRAKEKLIITSASENWDKKLADLGAKIKKDTKASAYTVSNLSSLSDMILVALLKHPDSHTLRNAAGLPASYHIPCNSSLYTEIIRKEIEQETNEETANEYEVIPELLDEIKERLSYSYRYNELNSLVAKRIASDLKDDGFNEEFYASAIPAFACEGRLTPAQRGTATHRFMQYSDYKKAQTDLFGELERLVKENRLTEEEKNAVNIGALKRFFASPLAERMLRSKKIYKEYPFTVALDVRDIYPEVSDEISKGESILVEGICDCAFEEDGGLVIVDYKTDKTESEEELKQKYAAQLNIYRKCLSMTLDIPVKEAIIYSFKTNKETII